MGHFDDFCNCDKHIRQYGVSFADSVDCNGSVSRAELKRLPCVITIATSRPTSLCVLVCRPMLEADVELTLSRLHFY